MGLGTTYNFLERGENALQKVAESGKLNTKNGWLACPVCKRNKRLLRITPETVAHGLPVYCRDCKTEVILDIEQGQSVERRSQ